MLESFKNFLKDTLDLREGKEHNEKITEAIQNEVEFRGARLWILVFAIFLASIGLNINSIPVIVGSMLISPLMGPILGLGLSLGTNDSHFLRKSFKHLAIAAVISVTVSTIYFLISPIANAQSELLARVSPTIYDILIAFFGGLAGIVSMTRKEKGLTVIPGVAIATALMPPLCTIGYGIATGQPKFFLGALYLFAINCIFICIATFLAVRYLKLPVVRYIDKKEAKWTKRIIAITISVMIIPAAYFAYVFVRENNFYNNAEQYIKEIFTDHGHAIIYKKIDYASRPQTIELGFLLEYFEPNEIAQFRSYLPQYNLMEVTLVIRQDNEFLTEEEWNSIIASIKDEGEKVKAIEAKLASGFVSPDTVIQIFDEARSINEKITQVAVGNLSFAPVSVDDTSTPTSEESGREVIIVYTNSEPEPLSLAEEEIIRQWLTSRMRNSSILIYFISANPNTP